ncbi:tRNA (adenosine(37)-N6)-threonylcarbamoyltransferase complex ATPase subunit type 1 TsaE [soil metagenome]
MTAPYGLGVFLTEHAASTQTLGARIAQFIEPGDALLLHGDLGAGKTTFAQGLLRGLNSAQVAQSPTFTFVSEHAGTTAKGHAVLIRHIDLYRFEELADLDSIGFVEIIDDPGAIAIVEWPERAAGALPANFLLFEIEIDEGERRRITLSASRPPDRDFRSLIVQGDQRTEADGIELDSVRSLNS